MGKNGGTADTSTTIGYTSDVITDMALATLEKRDTNKPFCMLYHHKAPHRILLLLSSILRALIFRLIFKGNRFVLF